MKAPALALAFFALLTLALGAACQSSAAMPGIGLNASALPRLISISPKVAEQPEARMTTDSLLAQLPTLVE